MHLHFYSHFQVPFMESRWLGKQSLPFQLKVAHFTGRVMDWDFMFPKTASQLAWESAGSTSEWVSLGSFSYLRVQTSSALSSGSQHPASSQSLWRWKSNTVHSQKMRQYCLTSALSQPTALRKTFHTDLNKWEEECSPNTAHMVASNWNTFLELVLQEVRRPHDHTVHIYITLWRACMIGYSTLSSHKTLMQRIRYIAPDIFLVCNCFTLLVKLHSFTAGCERALWPFCPSESYPTGYLWIQRDHSECSCARWTGDGGGLENNTFHWPHCKL